MCGLAGFIGNFSYNEKVRMSESLLMAIQERGRDATGYFTVLHGKSKVVKLHLPAEEFIPQMDEDFGRFAMLHVRAATHGEPEDNRNNHPIIGRKYILTHNGIVYNRE